SAFTIRPAFYLKEGAMKRIIAATLVAAALGAGNAQAAGSTSGQFNVNITLTSACTLGAVTPVAFAYTSLQGAAATATGGGFSVNRPKRPPHPLGLVARSA